jgi:hypothetical protein
MKEERQEGREGGREDLNHLTYFLTIFIKNLSFTFCGESHYLMWGATLKFKTLKKHHLEYEKFLNSINN